MVTHFRNMSRFHPRGGNLKIRCQSLEKCRGYENLLHWICQNQPRTPYAHMKAEMLEQQEWPTKVSTPNYTQLLLLLLRIFFPLPWWNPPLKERKRKRRLVACLCPVHLQVMLATTLVYTGEEETSSKRRIGKALKWTAQILNPKVNLI